MSGPPFVVLIPDNHRLAAKQLIEHSDLDGENVLMMGEGHCFRDQVLEACPGLQKSIRESSAQGNAVVEGSSLETLKLILLLENILKRTE